MEVLLKRSLDHLGRLGDVVTVKAGFARNYLLPCGHAVPVTKANIAQIDKERALALAEEKARLGDLRQLAEQMEQASVTIEGRANEDGHLFGSVGATHIAKALREKGYHIDDKQVRVEAPLKEIGVFEVAVHLHADVLATVKVWVVQAKPS